MDIITRAEAQAQGLTHYFTGKPCKHGHVALRITAGECVECRAAKWKTQEEKRRARRLVDPAFDQKMKEKQNRAGRVFTDKNPERRQELRDNWIAVPANKARKQDTNNRHKKTEKAGQARRARHNWRYQADPDYANRCKADAAHQGVMRRRAKTLVPLTTTEQAQVKALYHLRLRLTRETGIEYHVDHRIPLSKGGKHHPDNLWVIPAVENLRKGAKLPAAA